MAAEKDPVLQQGMPPAGDGKASEMFAALYQELHALAERHLGRSSDELTLGASTLLHEAYLSLSERDQARFPDRERFLAYASRAMRGLIIDYVRARRATKRGGGFEITRIGDHDVPSAPDGAAEPASLERLSTALDSLALLDPGLAQLVDLHFFCGFSLVEIAAGRDVSERTVQRDWKKARLLLRQMAGAPEIQESQNPRSS